MSRRNQRHGRGVITHVSCGRGTWMARRAFLALIKHYVDMCRMLLEICEVLSALLTRFLALCWARRRGENLFSSSHTAIAVARHCTE